MSNTDVEKARAYHRRTSHTTSSVRESGHWLDFSNLPLGLKVYEDLAPLPLTVPAGRLPVATMEALGLRGDRRDRGGPSVTVEDTRVPDLTDLIRLLHYSAGITRRIKRQDGSTMPFRAAACTGALYEIDLYVVCQDLAATGETPLPDGRTHLAAGVYHHSVHDGSSRRFARQSIESPQFAAMVRAAMAPLEVQSQSLKGETSHAPAPSWKHEG